MQCVDHLLGVGFASFGVVVVVGVEEVEEQVHAPTEGAFAAMTDQSGPGSRVLFQDFVVPSSVGFAEISFDYTINNQAGSFINGPGLDYASGPNQQARVDIITTTANEFSVAGGDVLLNLFQTNPDSLIYFSSDGIFFISTFISFKS